MRKWKRILSLTLALMLSLTLLAPAASAAGVKNYQYIKFSNEPIGYATISYTDRIGNPANFTVMVLPDNTTVSALNPDGGGYISGSIVGEIRDGNFTWDGGGRSLGYYDERFPSEPQDIGSYGGYGINFRSYTIYGERIMEDMGNGYQYMSAVYKLLEHVNCMSESEIKAISGGGVSVTMLPADQPMTEKTMQLADTWALPTVNQAIANSLMCDVLVDNSMCDLRVNITRADFAALSVTLYEAMSGQRASEPDWDQNPFKDTHNDTDREKYILQASELGIVGGKGEGIFAPDELVTRAQAATMLSRVYTKLGGTIPAVDSTKFSDNGSIPAYAKSAVAFMSEKGIVGGYNDGTFNPNGNATIQQALVIAMRMFDNLK